MSYFSESKPLNPGDAIAIARVECEKEGWPWLGPVILQTNPMNWIVITGYDASGRNVRMVISRGTGEVVCKSFIRRRAQDRPQKSVRQLVQTKAL
jgi:hypothetical protein